MRNHCPGPSRMLPGIMVIPIPPIRTERTAGNAFLDRLDLHTTSGESAAPARIIRVVGDWRSGGGLLKLLIT